MSSADPVETRQETLRFLHARRALPHQLSAVHAGLRRAGSNVSEAEVQVELDYLVSAGFAVRLPGPMGGGNRHASWKITHLGCNQQEES